MANGEDREEELANRQTSGLYPIGRALRSTFDAENHDSLGRDLTALMMQLATIEPPPPPAAPLPATTPAAPPPSLLKRLFDRALH